MAASEKITRFTGLDNPTATSEYFKSPEGQALIGEIVNRAEVLKEQIKVYQEQLFLAELQKDILKAILRNEYEEAKEEALHNQQIQQTQEQLSKATSESQSSNTTQTTSSTSYEDQLNNQLESAQKEFTQTKARYEQYDQSIAKVDSMVDKILPPKTDISKLNLKEKEKALDSIDTQIKEIEGPRQKRDKEADKIMALVDAGKYDEANTLRDKINARNLQVGTLKDMSAVVKGDKEMYNLKGEKVTSFQEADFVVPKNKQLVKEGDQFYLFSKEAKFGELTSDDKNKASSAFYRARPELSSVKNMMVANRAGELGAIDKKVTGIMNELEKLQVQQNAKTNVAMSSPPNTVTVPKVPTTNLTPPTSPPSNPSNVNSQTMRPSPTSKKY